MAEGVEEAVAQDGALGLRLSGRVAEPLVEVADRAPQRHAVRARPDHVSRELERFLRLGVPRDDLRIGRPDRERPRHVGEAAALDVPGEEVADDHVVVGDPSRSHGVAVRRLRAGGRDQVVATAAGGRKGGDRCRAKHLARQRRAVDDPSAVPGLRAGEQRRDRGGPRLGGTRRAVDALELERALPASAVVEHPLVDHELDARLAQSVGEPDGELAGHLRAPEAEGLHLPDDVGRCEVVEVDALADEVVDGEGLRVDDVDGRIDGGDAVALDAPHDRDPALADLRVQERVADTERKLVPQLGRTFGVAHDQDVRHHPSLSREQPRTGWVGCVGWQLRSTSSVDGWPRSPTSRALRGCSAGTSG